MQEICLLHRKCRSQGCHCLSEARLVHGDHIHISLAQDDIACPGGSCEIQSVEVPPLIEDHGLRGVQVFRFPVSHDSATEADDSVVNVLYGEHDAIPELTAQSPLFGKHCQSGILDLFVRKSFFPQILYHLLAVFPGIAQSEMVHGLIGELSICQIPHSHFTTGIT